MAVTMRGSRKIGAPRDIVWAALNDVGCLRHCIPSCQSLERTSERSFALSVLIRFGLIRATFAGQIEIFDSVPSCAYSLRGAGEGVLGRAAGTTRISIMDVPGGCRLAYRVEAEAQGLLATLGPFVMTGIGTALTNQFAASLAGLFDGDTQKPSLAAACSSSTMSSSV